MLTELPSVEVGVEPRCARSGGAWRSGGGVTEGARPLRPKTGRETLRRSWDHEQGVPMALRIAIFPPSRSFALTLAALVLLATPGRRPPSAMPPVPLGRPGGRGARSGQRCGCPDPREMRRRHLHVASRSSASAVPQGNSIRSRRAAWSSAVHPRGQIHWAPREVSSVGAPPQYRATSPASQG